MLSTAPALGGELRGLPKKSTLGSHAALNLTRVRSSCEPGTGKKSRSPGLAKHRWSQFRLSDCQMPDWSDGKTAASESFQPTFPIKNVSDTLVCGAVMPPVLFP